MAEKDRPGDEDAPVTSPAQIPLLEDVVEDLPSPKKTPRKKKRVNYSLDLNPDPPQTRDLFAEPAPEAPPSDAEDGASTDSESDPWGIMEAGRQEPAAPEPDDLDVADETHEPIASTELDAHSISRREHLRAEAEEMVEHLVQEYSQEIVQRLRNELTALLDELTSDPEDPDES